MTVDEKFINPSNVTSLVGQIKAKADETYISKTDNTVAKKTDITITGITVNGTAVAPVNKVVAIETIGTDDVNDLITTALGGITKFSLEVVSALPTSDIKRDAIYLVPNSATSGQNMYNEYVYIGEGDSASWEQIGTKDLDLSSYVTLTKLTEELAKKADKTELPECAFTDELKTKLDGIETGAQKNTVTSVAGRIGAVTIGISDVNGLQAALDAKLNAADALTDEEIANLVNAGWK